MRKTRFLLLLSLFLFAFGCSKSASEKKDGDPKAEEPAKAKTEKVEEAPKGDVYPGFQLGLLKPSNRIRFVNFAKAELCPCEDNNAISLDACLRKREGRCKVAMQVAEMSGMMYEAGFSDTDISDKVTDYIENTKKDHVFNLEGRPFKGSETAPVTLVEFADFQCPHCKEASHILADIAKSNGDDVKIVYKHFPLSAHAFSPIASQAAVAAQNQGKFWPMHDLLFKHQKNLDPGKLMEFGQRIGLNMAKYKADLESPATAAYVAEDRKEGENAKLTGTPSIYMNGKLYLGEIDKREILAAILEAKTSATTDETN